MSFRVLFMFCFVLLLFFNNCTRNRDKVVTAFLDKFESYDFKNFMNTYIWLRGVSTSGERIYFVYKYDLVCEAPFIVILNANTSEVVNIDYKLREYRCEDVKPYPDSVFYTLMNEFKDLGISGLEVREETVEIEFTNDKSISILKSKGCSLVGTKVKTDLYKKIKGCWFIKV